jgi:hypothetical protein
MFKEHLQPSPLCVQGHKNRSIWLRDEEKNIEKCLMIDMCSMMSNSSLLSWFPVPPSFFLPRFVKGGRDAWLGAPNLTCQQYEKKKKPKIICYFKSQKNCWKSCDYLLFKRCVWGWGGGDFTNQKSRQNEIIFKNKLPKSYMKWLDLWKGKKQKNKTTPHGGTFGVLGFIVSN